MYKLSFVCAALVATSCASTLASASSEKVIYDFVGNSRAYGQLQEDSLGDLYGTTASGNNNGTVYRLRQHRGLWRGSIIHRFGSGSDGNTPYAGLTPNRDAGTFYGSTYLGGASDLGTIYSLIRPRNRWKESVLYNFDGLNGAYPSSPLSRDKATNILFGTTRSGGIRECGVAFSLDPADNAFQIIHHFRGRRKGDGCIPSSQLREGAQAGTLFGSTLAGAHKERGTLFMLTAIRRRWQESVIHKFKGYDGIGPVDIAMPANDPETSIYGVAQSGGKYGHGVVFRIARPGPKKWRLRVIYNFTGADDGDQPVGIDMDRGTGVLYGTTAAGGSARAGVIFQLAKTGGVWTQTILHAFTGGKDGAQPQSRPILDPKTGVLYGTTLNGGIHNGGVVYAVTP